MNTLPHRLGVYVPTRDREGRKLPSLLRKDLLTQATRQLCAACGGATHMPAHGMWIDAGGQLHEESVTVVYAYVTAEGLTHARQVLGDVARDILQRGAQASVMVEVDQSAVMYE